MKKLFDSAPNGRQQTNAPVAEQGMDIAIIGMAGRIAGASDLDSFWKRLLNKEDFIVDLPERRMKDIQDYLTYQGIKSSSILFKPASFLQEIDCFDHGFFNISSLEASIISPDQRILLEVIWHTLEEAGYAGDKIRGSRTGVYLGYANEKNEYMQMISNSEPGLAAMALTGNVASVMAGRIAHFLDLKGPTMLVNTACSSSLVAIHQACRAILSGDCDMALTGGIHLLLSPIQPASTSGEGLGVESASGVTRSFDDTSDGTGGGEGCITYLLKPLSKAVQDNDRILAVIKGSAINQDGRSISIASPNVTAQEEVITAAWKNAHIDPRTLSYIETHGTGTPLGDPIEIAGITAAFRKYTDRKQFCAISALKSNIGHLDAAAGAAGVAKAVLSLHNKTMAPSLHFEKPNRHIPFEDSPVYINTRTMPWERRSGPLRCGVSAFGLSGTNAHIVLEEAPSTTPDPDGRQETPCLFVLSATSSEALKRLAINYLDWLSSTPDHFNDICYTTGAGRGHFSCRMAIVAKDNGELLDSLNAWQRGDTGKFQDRVFEYDIAGLKGNIAHEQQVRELSHQATHWISVNSGNRHDMPFLEKLASFYVNGAAISWDNLFQHEERSIVKLPLYPFQPKRCWMEFPEQRREKIEKKKQPTPAVQQAPATTAQFPMTPAPVTSDAESIFTQFQTHFSQSFDIPSESINKQTSVYEIGLDSITIVQVRLMIKRNYGVDIPVIDIFRKYMKIGDLAVHIGTQLQTHASTGNSKAPENTPSDTLKSVVYRPDPRKISKPVSTMRLSDGEHVSTITPAQQAYLDRFMEDYQRRSSRSLEYTRLHMPHFANNRNVSAFKKANKKLHYTIFAERVDGSRIWDIDGNEYIDFAMGFGVFFLGHNHPLIREALEQQLTRGTWLGPLSCLAGEVAQLVSEITGVERVAFYNSGTEAVMVAIRLARSATGRNKIVLFTGSYHGMFDGLLAQRNAYSEAYETVPLANGILQSMVDEVYVLEYDDPVALEFIKEHSQEIAAVLVEPVQSRRPALQPHQFLADLRSITADHAICLIFDEIITGFRIAPGGAQQFFNVQADLVTYGKVAGGGLPLGMVAGSAEYMMGIDGGIWDPTGDTLPRFDHRRTLVAGTFCHHPLALASAKAMLQYLQKEGQAIYDRLDLMTSGFVRRMNDYFISSEIPIRLDHCGSMFHFRSELDLKIFFCHLIYKGIYVWEGATFFVSAAHSPEDIARFESAIKESISELRTVGMMNTTETPGRSQQNGKITNVPGTKVWPLTNEQSKIWLKCQESSISSAIFNELIPYNFQGRLDENALQEALRTLISRHAALRTRRVSMEGQYIDAMDNRLPLHIHKVDARKDSPEASHQFAHEWMRKEVQRPFAPEQGFIRAFLISYGKDKHIFGLIIHQLIADGFSLSLVQSELQQLYECHSNGRPHNLPIPADVSAYITKISEMPAAYTSNMLDFWTREWERPSPSPFIRDPFSKAGIYPLKWTNVILPDALYTEIRTLAKLNQTTPFVILLTAHITTVRKLTGLHDIITGIPSVGQLMLDDPCLVGQCMQLLPFRWNKQDGHEDDPIAGIRDKFNRMQEFRDFMVKDILEYADARGIPCNVPEVRIVFNMDPPIHNRSTSAEVNTLDFVTGDGMIAKYDLFINVVEVNKQLHFSFEYNTTLFSDLEIRHWARTFFTTLTELNAAIPPFPTEADDTSGSVTPPASWTALIAHRIGGNSGRVQWNDKEIDFSDCLHQGRLRAAGSLHPVILATDDAEALLISVLACEHDKNNYALLTPGQRTNVPDLPEDAGLPDEGIFSLIDGLTSPQWMHLEPAIYYAQLSALAERLNIPAGSNLWLLPAQLLPAELLNWWWMALLQGWNLVVSTTPPAYDTDQPWIVCADIDAGKTLTALPECCTWHSSSWIVITSGPVSNIHLKDWAFLGNELKVHIITRMTGSALYVFHNALNYKLRNPAQIISAGKALNPSLVCIVDEDGLSAAPYAQGILRLTGSADRTILTRYRCTAGGDHIFTVWTSAPDTIRYREFTLDERLLLDTTLSHPQIISASLRRESGSEDPRTMCLEVGYKQRQAPLLAPMDYLKIFFPKAILPGTAHWPGKTNDTKIGSSSLDPERSAILLQCVRDALRSPQAVLQDSFLESGGSSIQAIHLVTMIRNRMGMEINPGKLFIMKSLESILLPENAGDAGSPESRLIAPASQRTTYPLSFTQKRFWITEHLEGQVRTSSLVETRRVHGELEEPVFYQACLAVVDRHESLRTAFIMDGSEPVQKILPAGKDAFDYRFEDWEGEQDPLARLQNLRDWELEQPFQLDKGPILRIRLLRIGPAEFATIIVTHHIIFDGWSFDVMMKDIITAYKRLREGEQPFTQPLPIQFRDYCVWHNDLIIRQADKFKLYREKKFGTIPRPLTLVKNGRRPTIKQQEAGMSPMIIDRETTAALRAIGESQGATMFMVVHASLLALLYYYSGESDIVLGIPVAHRGNTDLQPLIGSLINTMAIRTTFKDNDSFLELLARGRMDALEAFEHEEYPFDLLLSDMNYPRDASRNPLFDIGFTYHEKTYLNEMPGVRDLGIRSEEIPVRFHSVMADMWVNATLDQGYLNFNILYDQAIYSTSFIAGFVEDYTLLLQTISSRPAINLQDLIVRYKAIRIKKTADAKKRSDQRNRQSLRKIKEGSDLE